MELLGGVHFDSYTWRARVLPMFIALFPIGIVCVLWLPNFMLVARLITAFAGPLGLAMLLSQIGRDHGSRKQPSLWQRWGGSPTIQLLRHRSKAVNPVIRQRYHEKLSMLRPDLTLPTPDEELRDPIQADRIYEACVQYLISRTRDHKRFSMVFKENVNYGFRRNLWGLRPVGVTLSALALSSCVLRLWLFKGTSEFRVSDAIAGSILVSITLVFWIFSVTADWVRIPADAYASRLLETSEDLEIH